MAAVSINGLIYHRPMVLTHLVTMWPSPNPILLIIIYMKYWFQLKFLSYSIMYFVISLMRLLLLLFLSLMKLSFFRSLQLTPGGVFINNCEWRHQCHFSELH